MRIIAPDHLFKFILFTPLAGSDLPAITPRRAPADPVRLKQDDVIAALCQMQCR